MTDKQYADLLCAIGTLSKVSGGSTTIPQEIIDAIDDRYTKEEVDSLLEQYQKLGFNPRTESLKTDFDWVETTQNITVNDTKCYLNRYKVVDDTTTPKKIMAELTTDIPSGIPESLNVFGFTLTSGTTVHVLHSTIAGHVTNGNTDVVLTLDTTGNSISWNV